MAAMVLGEHYVLQNTSYKKIDLNYAKNISGSYKFDENFYVPNYKLEIHYNDGYLSSQWGDLIPIDKGKKNMKDYILRTYWSSIHFLMDNSGKCIAMEFDDYKGMKIK